MEALKPHIIVKKEKNPLLELSGVTRNLQKPGIEKMVRRHAQITTIIFDLAEVQFTGMEKLAPRLEPILKRKAEEIDQSFRGEDLRALDNGKISEDEYLDRVLKKTGWRTTKDLLKRMIRENFIEVEGTREIIEKLRKHGFKLGILSVHGREWIEYISAKFGHHKLFDAVSYSFEEGISKPDKIAYEQILKKLDSRPEESIFIDDREANLKPAQELGMKVILFKDAKGLEEKLREMGVQI